MSKQRTKLITTKLTPLALKLNRMIAAVTGELQLEVMDRLLLVEARRVGLPEHLIKGWEKGDSDGI